ncbi:MAG: hypothetical protein LC802_05925 [Acidobacteria bacterium]|nr:hypothetical protein [Acidobacteriota bacterium]
MKGEERASFRSFFILHASTFFSARNLAAASFINYTTPTSLPGRFLKRDVAALERRSACPGLSVST